MDTVSLIVSRLSQHATTLALGAITIAFSINGFLSFVVGQLKSFLGKPSPSDSPAKVRMFKVCRVLDELALNTQRIVDMLDESDLRRKLEEHEQKAAALAHNNATLRMLNEAHSVKLIDQERLLGEQERVISRQASNIEQITKLVPKQSLPNVPTVLTRRPIVSNDNSRLPPKGGPK